MDKTGSIAIDRATLSGRGAVMSFVGLLILLGSAAAHSCPTQLTAALVFALGLAGLRLLARFDSAVLSTPWAGVVRTTDLLSLVLLSAATFGPLYIVAVEHHAHWDVPVLVGALLLWWSVLDRLIADYRRIRVALAVIALGWAPVVFLHPTDAQIALDAEITALLAIGVSIWSIRRAMSGAPNYYRLIDVSGEKGDAA